MPTTLPIAHQRARAPLRPNRAGRIVVLARRTRDELQKILTSNDFKTVAMFSAVGLLLGLLAMLFGVQGAWM